MSDTNGKWTPARLIATVGGVGRLIRKAPGTAGSLAGAVVAPFLPFYLRIAVIVALFFIGAFAATAYERETGRTDPGEVVIDEVAGQLIATLGHLGTRAAVGSYLIPCFILFRIFDILKPWPVSACERLPRGWGIMLDDVVAGAFASLTLFALRKVFVEGYVFW